jgi:hypothetical protein
MAAQSLFQWLGRFYGGILTYRRPLLLQTFIVFPQALQFKLDFDSGASKSHETLSQHGYLCTF